MRRPNTLRVIAVAIVLIAAALAVPLAASPATAHSKLLSTSPLDGTVLDAPPASVSFTFNEPLLAGAQSISVSDDHGNVVASEAVEPDRATISMPWPAEAASGMFTIAYRAASDDGHPISGAIVVTITAAAAAGTPSPASTVLFDEPEPVPRSIAAGLVVFIALGVLLLALLSGVVIWRRRRS